MALAYGAGEGASAQRKTFIGDLKNFPPNNYHKMAQVLERAIYDPFRGEHSLISRPIIKLKQDLEVIEWWKGFVNICPEARGEMSPKYLGQLKDYLIGTIFDQFTGLTDLNKNVAIDRLNHTFAAAMALDFPEAGISISDSMRSEMYKEIFHSLWFLNERKLIDQNLSQPLIHIASVMYLNKVGPGVIQEYKTKS